MIEIFLVNVELKLNVLELRLCKDFANVPKDPKDKVENGSEKRISTALRLFSLRFLWGEKL